MAARRDVLWLATGLSPELTGVERVVVNAAQALLKAIPGLRLRVLMDEDADWTGSLPPVVDVVTARRRAAQLVRPAPRRLLHDVQAVHSFGALLPTEPATRLYTVHDWGPFRDGRLDARTRLLWGAAVLGSVRRATLVHVVSGATAQAMPGMVRRAVGDTPVVTGGVTRPRHTTGAHTARNDDLLHVGGPVPRRRLDLLLAAMERSPDLRLVLVGSGTERLDLPANVLAAGRVGEADLVDLYRSCRAVVLLSDYEGIGLPVTEGAAHGAPAVVSPGVARAQPAWVQPGLTIVDPEDPAALDTALHEAREPRLHHPAAGADDELVLAYGGTWPT